MYALCWTSLQPCCCRDSPASLRQCVHGLSQRVLSFRTWRRSESFTKKAGRQFQVTVRARSRRRNIKRRRGNYRISLLASGRSKLLVSGVHDPVLSEATSRFLSERQRPIDRISEYQQPRLANKYYYSCWSASSSTAFTLPVCTETVFRFFPRKLSPRSLNTVASSKMRSSAYGRVRTNESISHLQMLRSSLKGPPHRKKIMLQ